jgi:hypothetical protein
MSRILLLLALTCCDLCGFSQKFSFFKESITMKIEGDAFYVTGIYWLRGEPGQSKLLMYPYPMDPSFGKVDSIYIYNMTSGLHIVPAMTRENGTWFSVSFGSDREIELQISYKQMLYGNRAQYILRSTKEWKKPLELANYQLIVPATYRITGFSIPPQDTALINNETLYYWEKTNFLPREDMIFGFVKTP